MTGDVSSKIRWIRLFFVVCWLLLDIGVLIHRLLTSKVSHDSWQAHMGGGIAGITLGKREIVWKIRVKLVYLGLLILWNPKPLNWEIKLKWTGLAIYIVVMISVILSIIFHPKPKSYRMYDPPCSLFRVCKQMDAAFQCSAMTTREQKWWKREVTIFIDRIIWLVIKIKKIYYWWNKNNLLMIYHNYYSIFALSAVKSEIMNNREWLTGHQNGVVILGWALNQSLMMPILREPDNPR